ncbi:hypothetical protein [Actinomyces procaprae]|uniref:hypothetical protein n=1 Tax=Actinomyces procaprae TaxID=2560010 RepID=UPI001EFF7018|nr:hypothetical protein [Actinomyces procaprae]
MPAQAVLGQESGHRVLHDPGHGHAQRTHPLQQRRGRVVGVEQGEGEQRIIGVSFHPELTGDTTIHRDLPD